MFYIRILLYALALSTDAFAVSMCKGLAAGKVKPRQMLLAGAWFGGFQALMPLIGYFLGKTFQSYIESYDHWIALVLLGFIGGKMIVESFDKEIEETSDSFGFRTMLVMAIATSIDALAVGVTFVGEYDNIIALPIIMIGVITFVLSAVGVKLGSFFGTKYKSGAELFGGVVLVGIGIWKLIEHLVNGI